MRFLRMLPVFVAVLILAADRFTKSAVQHSMTIFDTISVVPGWLRIVHYQNPGAAFGMLADGNPLLRKLVLIGISVVVLGFVASALFGRGQQFNHPVPRIGLALILGGAIGNLYDRVLHGTVTDFIEVYHGTWSFPAFNVADSAITVGATVLAYYLLRSPQNQPDGQPRLVSK